MNAQTILSLWIRRLRLWILSIPMALLAVSTVYPLIFTFNVSLKTRKDWIINRFAWAENPNFDRLVINEKRLRKANEGRAKNKNKIDKAFKSIFKKGKSNE